MSLVPARFLLRAAYPCRFVNNIPKEDDRLLELPGNCPLENFAEMDGTRNYADVRVAWNDMGFAVQVEVKGKDQLAVGDVSRPRGSDGLTVWIDTRDARTSHRASRFCHQFHFLPTGGGPEKDEPVFLQTKINRALQDAPLCAPNSILFQGSSRKGGYVLEAFLPAAALNGFDPEQNPRWGIYYSVRDNELGEQVLSVGSDFPYWEDPSLWSVLALVR